MSKAYRAHHRDSTSEEACAAARRFADECLVRDGSLFTPEKSVWTLEAITEFYERAIADGDFSKSSFLDKLERQLAGADARVIQLAAETVYVNLLSAIDTGAAAKRNAVSRILSWSSERVEVPDGLDMAFEQGVGSIGRARMFQWRQVGFLTLLAIAFKHRPVPDRAALVSDPWQFKELLASINAPSAQTQRHAILFLLFPETYEPILSDKHKLRLAAYYSHLIESEATDPDRQIAEIRHSLSEVYGPGFGFYDAEVRRDWLDGDSKQSPWDELIHWAKRFHEWEGFDERERDYKLRAADLIAGAREMLLRDEAWQMPLRRALTSSTHNLVSWRTSQPFLTWVEAEPYAAQKALTELWSTDDRQSAIAAFLGSLPSSIDRRGNQLEILSFLLMAVDPLRYPPVKVTSLSTGFRLTHHAVPPDDSVGFYVQALGFLDRIIEEANNRDLKLRDRLDAQSLLWAIVGWGSDSEAASTWSASERSDYGEYRRRNGLMDAADAGDAPPVDVDPPPPLPDPYTALADELLLPVDFLHRVRRLLEDKRQVIFYGPPGTGKTFVAQKLAELFAGDPESYDDGGSVELVQFHPSYAYEDFVQGYRPARDGGFVLRDGPLLRIAERARHSPETTHVLVIDEINRGNVAKVFGELYFLLEYRDRAMSLQYADEPFTLPSNLWIIGTMNTADRSIALIDAALRRRFHFVPFFPSEPPIKGLLRNWLERHKPEMRHVAGYVDRANALLGDRDAAIGPSHFMRPNLDDEWLEMIWTHSVLPYVAEHYFGQEERVQEFALDAIRGRHDDDAVDDATPDAG